MTQITVESRGSVVLARLSRGVTNALDLACVEELAEVIQQVRGAPDVRALVVASSNDKFFSMCCDYRFIAEGRKLMGLNEVKLGVPVPYVADRVLHALVGARQARRVMEGGEFYGPEESLEMGMVDQVWPLERVVEEAVEKAEALGSLPGTAYGMIKRNRVEAVEAEIAAWREEKEGAFIECWYSDEARERLREAMDKF